MQCVILRSPPYHHHVTACVVLVLIAPLLFSFSAHFFFPRLPSSSLYQPPRRRPSAVWSPCAATNMGRAAVPAWPASWSKWPDSARPALTIAMQHPAAAATGGEGSDNKKQSLWILTKPHLLLVWKILAAVRTVSAHNDSTVSPSRSDWFEHGEAGLHVVVLVLLGSLAGLWYRSQRKLEAEDVDQAAMDCFHLSLCVEPSVRFYTVLSELYWTRGNVEAMSST